MRGRVVIVFGTLLFCFAILTCNLMLVASNTAYARAAVGQSIFRVPLDDGRGNFYDCRFRQLTGTTTEPCVLVAPCAESYRTLFDVVESDYRTVLYANIQRSAPFLLPLMTVSGVQAPVFPRIARYSSLPIAEHLLGYCGAGGGGLNGLEAVYNDYLSGGSTKREVYCQLNAQGGFVSGETPRVLPTQGTGNGVMLTIDAALQRMCESVASERMDQGCIVVMETQTGRIRACVSMPGYDPNRIAESMESEQSPLLNRAVCQYSVGSVFKPLLAAAALEEDVALPQDFVCTGSITVADHTYRCAYGKGHGEVDLEEALAQSCNCYFIQLGQELGGETLLRYARVMGFGQSQQIAGALRTAKGNLPTAQQLDNLGELATFSFGQGTLMATPVQMAAFFNAIANEGEYISPTFVEGLVNEYTQTITQSLYNPVRRRALSAQTAEKLRQMLVHVVEDGLGKSAEPVDGTAGGKTSTAQTGRYTEQGKEIMNAWFAGFYPAEKPEYTVVVLLDGGMHSSEDACRVFSGVTSALRYFTAASGEELDNAAN